MYYIFLVLVCLLAGQQSGSPTISQNIGRLNLKFFTDCIVSILTVFNEALENLDWTELCTHSFFAY